MHTNPAAEQSASPWNQSGSYVGLAYKMFTAPQSIDSISCSIIL